MQPDGFQAWLADIVTVVKDSVVRRYADAGLV
jgi:hypothetical protein